MSLPVRDLDDRRFQDLVDEAKRLIPTYCPEWTNHNVSDPGVALIELFAWMTEMAIYRLNQVPDTFYTRMLNLLGFERFPAKAARADVTFWLTAATAPTVGVPAGTEVTTDARLGTPRVFTLLDDLEIHQPTLISALTSSADIYTDVWEDLRLALAPVTCFTSTPLTPGDCFYLGFEDSLAGNVVRLAVTANVEGIGVIPERPPLAWEVWGGEAWIPVEVPTRLDDGSPGDTTGGLNRNGSVALLVPRVHEPLTLSGTRAYWLRARLLAPEPLQPAYRASPQLLEVHATSIGGTGVVEHSELVVDEFVGLSNGKPNQRFELDLSPVLSRAPTEHLVITTPDGTTHDWEEVDDFIRSGKDDLHYVIDSSTGEVVFGPTIRQPDGSWEQHGAVPHEGARIVMTRYRSGGGAAGNVGAGSLNSLRESIPYIGGASNLRSATGGVDAEEVENAKLRGPHSIRAGSRAVTATDFERLTTEADSGVGRVRCLPPVESGEPIRVLIVPNIEEPPEHLRLDDFALPDDMIRRVSAHLDERRILGSAIEIGTPYYQGVTVAALVAPRPGRPPTLIRDRVLATLYRYLNPLTGGADGNGWKFDEDLNAANVFHLLEAIEGVDRVDEVLFFEYDLRNHERLGFGKELVKLAPDSLFLSSNHQVVVR